MVVLVVSSPLLPIGLDHGGRYQGVKKENCLRVWLWHGEYHAMLGEILI